MVQESEVPRQMDDELWRVRDVAAFLGVTERTIRRWVRAKYIPCRKVGGGIYFLPTEIRAWVKEQPAA